jgi:hypothetical protein
MYSRINDKALEIMMNDIKEDKSALINGEKTNYWYNCLERKGEILEDINNISYYYASVEKLDKHKLFELYPKKAQFYIMVIACLQGRVTYFSYPRHSYDEYIYNIMQRAIR